MKSEQTIREEICEVGRRIYHNGFVAANDGNISVRISENEILATPTGVSKGFMTPEILVKVNMKGEIISSDGKNKPSSELKMHLRVYAERPDVKSVVHTHAPYSTSFAVSDIPLVKPIMTEVVVSIGCVPVAKYATPSTNELPDSISEYLQNYDAVLLSHHGVLTYSDDLFNAYYKMETVEFYAKIMYISKVIGGPKELPEIEVTKLHNLREKYGMTGKHPGELYKLIKKQTNTKTDEEELISKIVKEEFIRKIVKEVISELNIGNNE